MAVFDALAANRPVPLGEATGPQSAGRLHLLSRPVPGGEAAADLTGRMIALASGRGAGGGGRMARVSPVDPPRPSATPVA